LLLNVDLLGYNEQNFKQCYMQVWFK